MGSALVSNSKSAKIVTRDTSLKIKKLIGPRILVRQCVNDHWRKSDGSVLLYRTEESYDGTNWAEIIMVSPECKEFSEDDIGKFVHCPFWTDGMNRIGDYEFTIHERLIADKKLKPFVVEM